MKHLRNELAVTLGRRVCGDFKSAWRRLYGLQKLREGFARGVRSVHGDFTCYHNAVFLEPFTGFMRRSTR